MQAHKPRSWSSETPPKSLQRNSNGASFGSDVMERMFSLKEDDVKKGHARAELLVMEVDRAKESERKMLESLMEQTRQLEQTKISLEEAKLELRELKNYIGSDKEIEVLRNELKLATEAEDKSKKAMDDLAIALHEVTIQANKAKSEMQLAKAEAKRLMIMLNFTEEKLRTVAEESTELKLQLAESAAAWTAKENGFIDCMKVSEEEISKANRENDRLIDSQRMSREDISKLRDVLKQAVNEATLVKEALEITRKENAQLKELLSEKDNALRKAKQDYECLKVSEASAVCSVRELKGLLAPTSTVESSKIVKENEVKESRNVVTIPSEHWKGENPRIRLMRRHSVGGDAKSKNSIYDLEGTLERRNRILQSDSLVPSLFLVGDGSASFDDFIHMDRNQLAGPEHDSMKQKKKKPMMRRFGDMIRRRSFHK